MNEIESRYKVVRIILLGILMLLHGCASSFDQTSKIESFHYEIGSTTKSEVINYIGFPDAYIQKEKVVILAYKGAADSTNYFIPIPVHALPLSASTYLVTYLNAGSFLEEEENKIKESDVVYIFNSKSILEEVVENRETK